jgi:prepilin-type N-terminal cleavage/methylation domain-containing protein
MAGSYSRKKGLTLVEFAVVIVILGLLVGLGTVILIPLIERPKQQQTLRSIKEAREAVMAFASSKKRLPTPPEFSTITRNIDAWGGTLYYRPDESLATSENICCIIIPGLEVNDKGTVKKGIAFLIMSEGKDRKNETGTSPLFSVKTQGAGYDDIVEYVSIEDLKKNQKCRPVEIITETLPEATEDKTYFAKLQARSECRETDISSFNWSIVKGTLPQGLTLNSNGSVTGTVDAYPGPEGSLSECQTQNTFTMGVNNPLGVPAEKTLTLTLMPQKLRISDKDLSTASVNNLYSTTLSASGGKSSYTWSLTSGELPPGFTLSKSGTLSGRPAPGTEGHYTFTAELEDGCTSVSKKFSLAVSLCKPLTLSPPSAVTAVAGTAFHQTVTVSGGYPPYSVVMAGCKNSCSAFNMNLECRDTEAVLSGTPLKPGSCSFSVEWQDDCPSGSQKIIGSYTLTIQRSPAQSGDNSPR